MSGTYVYRQQGFEQICSSIRGCDEGDRPSGADVQVVRQAVSDAQVQVRYRAEYSPRWLSELTVIYGREGALLQEVSMDFQTDTSYRVDFSPDPYLEWFRYPFAEKHRWTRDWDDRGGTTQGTFEVRMAETEKLRVAGRRITARRMHYRLDWGADDYLDADIWLDPKTVVILKTVGTVRAGPPSSYYRYSFTMQLGSGPGY